MPYKKGYSSKQEILLTEYALCFSGYYLDKTYVISLSIESWFALPFPTRNCKDAYYRVAIGYGYIIVVC